MKAVCVHRFGGPEVLTYEDVPEPPAPGPGQAIVDLEVIGINFSDTNYRRGLGPAASMGVPLVPGHEAGGIVAAVGDGVRHVKAGDRVVFAGQHRLGTYKEKMLLQAISLVPVSPDMDMKIATAVLNQGRTAHYLAHELAPHQARPARSHSRRCRRRRLQPRADGQDARRLCVRHRLVRGQSAIRARPRGR